MANSVSLSISSSINSTTKNIISGSRSLLSPNENGLIVINLVFTDDIGTTHTFDELTSTQFQLSTTSGTVINNRTFVLSNIPDNGVIVLTDDDLQIIDDSDNGIRLIAFKLVYNSAALGSVNYNEEATFTINKLVNIV